MKKVFKKTKNKTTKVLLINAIDTSVEIETKYPNLGLSYLVSMVRKEMPNLNVDFKIIDHNIYNIIKDYKPDLVGITCVSQNFNLVRTYAKYLSKKNIPVILGGIHITLLPETLPITCLGACIGEGEYAFVDLIKTFIQSDSFVSESLSDIPGMIYWSKGKICKTKPRPMEMSLDNIPLPARDLLTIGPQSYMFTSRGCPYRCTFCVSSRFWDKLRFFSANYVVNEIEILINEYKVEIINFYDDLFIADRNRLKEILRLLKQRKLLGKVKYICACRANLVDKELISILKKMGVVGIGMGLESGNDETLKYLKGGTVNVKNNYQAVKLFKKAGITTNGSFIIGSPKETGEQIMDTYKFIKKSKIDQFDVYILTPYPGTPVWEYAKRKNIISIDKNFDWSKLDVNVYKMDRNKIMILSERLTKKQLLNYYNKFRRLKFYRKFFKVVTNPFANNLPKIAARVIKDYVIQKIQIKK